MAHWRDNERPDTQIVRVRYDEKEYYVKLNCTVEDCQDELQRMRRACGISLRMGGLRPT